jgi:hypothetical protein
MFMPTRSWQEHGHAALAAAVGSLPRAFSVATCRFLFMMQSDLRYQKPDNGADVNKQGCKVFIGGLVRSS